MLHVSDLKEPGMTSHQLLIITSHGKFASPAHHFTNKSHDSTRGARTREVHLNLHRGVTILVSKQVLIQRTV